MITSLAIGATTFANPVFFDAARTTFTCVACFITFGLASSQEKTIFFPVAVPLAAPRLCSTKPI